MDSKFNKYESSILGTNSRQSKWSATANKLNLVFTICKWVK